MASTAISSTTRATTPRNRKKNKKTNQTNTTRYHQFSNNPAAVSWKSESQQQLYSFKLLQALRRLHINSPSSSPKRGQAVRQAADQALAVAAKGKTRWSRAILTNRLKLKFLKKNNNVNKIIQKSYAITRSNNRWLNQRKGRSGILRLKIKNIPAVQRKVKVLGSLVPGCRKETLPVVLEEAGDYIAALEMQVRAMSALADLLSGCRSGSGDGATSGEAGSMN